MEVPEFSRPDLTADDVTAVSTAIEDWLTGVRRVLRTVDRLPRRVDVIDWLPRRVDVIDRPSVPGRARVSRALVQLYVDSHLVRRLKALDKALAIESLSVEDDERGQRLRTLHATIGEFRSNRRTQRIRNQVTKFIAPYILFVVGPAVILGGVDAEDVRAALVLAVLLASLVLYFGFVRFLTVPWGFVPKRALWSGGTTVQSIDRRGRAKERQWLGFPNTDLYRAEAVMFDALRVPVAVERPLDISILLDVFFGVVIAGVVAGVVAMVWSGAPIVGIVLVTLIPVGLTVQLVLDLGSNHRMRAARKHDQMIEPASGAPAVAPV